MAVEIISRSISTKVSDRAGIKLKTHGSAVRHVSAGRHVTDCATRRGQCDYNCLSHMAKTAMLAKTIKNLCLLNNFVLVYNAEQ